MVSKQNNRGDSSREVAGREEANEVRDSGLRSVGDVMTEAVTTVSPSIPLAAVAALMRDEKIGIVPVVDDEGRLAGVITDRDIVVRVDAEAAPVDLVRASDIMSTNLVTARREDDLYDVLDRMGEEAVKRILVIGDDNRLVGIVSIGDLARRTDLPHRLQDALDRISRRHS